MREEESPATSAKTRTFHANGDAGEDMSSI